MSDDSNTTPPPNNRLRLIIAVAVLIGAIILLIAVERASRVEPVAPVAPPSGRIDSGTGEIARAPAAPDEPRAAAGPTATRAFASGLDAPSAPVEGTRSPLADQLLAPDGDTRRDLAIVGTLLAHFRGEFHEMPVGNNAEITAALAGDNARAYAPLPPDHRAINAQGEIVDRWGTPLFFHQQSAEQMEIVSAGPDRRRFTPDDVSWPDSRALEVGQVSDLP